MRVPRSIPALKRMITGVVSRNVENKSMSVYQPGISLYSTAAATWDTQNIITVGLGASAGLSIQQGAGDGQRVGNSIKIKSMWWKGTIVPFAYDPTTNPNPCPQQIRLIFFYEKAAPTSKPTPKADFFQLGNTTNAVQNDLMDMIAPVNKDKYRVLGERRFKLGYSQFWGDGGGGAIPGDVAKGFYANNDFKYNANFAVNLAKMLPKRVRYNDNGATPVSRSLFCAAILCRADGTANLAAYAPVGMQWVIDVKYEDA